MNKEITLEAELFIALYIIAMGEWDGICFIDYPKLPNPFCENIRMSKECVGDLLSLRVDPSDTDNGLSVQLWFMDENENQFFYTWEEVMMVKPMLCAVVLTHIFDMIENMEDC